MTFFPGNKHKQRMWEDTASSLKCIKREWLVTDANGLTSGSRRSSHQTWEQRTQEPQPDQSHFPYYKPEWRKKGSLQACSHPWLTAPAWDWWQSPGSRPGRPVPPGLLSDFTTHVGCVHSCRMCSKALYKITSTRVTQHIPKHPSP